MVTKYILAVLALAICGSLAETCQNPQAEAASFTSLDATIVTQIAYITEFTLKCDNPLPQNFALYAEVEGKPLTAARISENRYQVRIFLILLELSVACNFLVVVDRILTEYNRN